MIHSLSGGVLKDEKLYDLAKIEIIEGTLKGDIYWYINNIFTLKENDIVLIPLGKNDMLTKGKVLRIDKSVSEKNSPIQVKRMKEIHSIV